MFLSQHAREVKLLLRGGELRKSMSDYLASRIEKTANVEVLTYTEVDGLRGEPRLQRVGIRSRAAAPQQIDCSGVFVFVGAKPHTEWLPDSIATDESGFVLAGPTVQADERWPLDRLPCELETTCPGVFVVGDVRSGTTKRCAFAVGDGALGITCVHQHLSRER
ncbi:MAG: FAD-dependent oxidoreductase [Planctomycetota bacterium]